MPVKIRIIKYLELHAQYLMAQVLPALGLSSSACRVGDSCLERCSTLQSTLKQNPAALRKALIDQRTFKQPGDGLLLVKSQLQDKGGFRESYLLQYAEPDPLQFEVNSLSKLRKLWISCSRYRSEAKKILSK